MTAKLVIFDFDGTLADTTDSILFTYRRTIEEMGLPERSDDECRATIGLPLREGFRFLYPDFSDSALDECVVTYRRIFNENKDSFITRLYPGVLETLNELKRRGVAMSVASSRSRVSLVELCESAGISGFFGLILGGDDVAHAKPNPEPVLLTLKTLGCEARNAVVVGDMPVDIAMGDGAGSRTVGVTYGNSSRAELVAAGATRVVDAMPDILLPE